MSVPTTQFDFSGGMNLFADDINLGPTEYGYSFNVRNREAGLSPIRLPIEDTTLMRGKKQGIFAFDKYILAFVSGACFYKNIITDSAWIQIIDFALDPYVDNIYVALVPASTFNFKRTLINADQASGTQTNLPVNVSTVFATPSPSGLIVQDGLNQPWFIFADGTARRTQSYNEWSYSDTVDNREYVPIMKQMVYTSAGILFGMAPDGITLLRSVSGRPADFVINVDTLGNKGGDAYTTSHSIGYNQINCLDTLTSGDIFLGSQRGCVILTLNYDSTIFAEPTFSVKENFAVGVVNQYSFLQVMRIDGNSYYYFIDTDGMRTFGSDSFDDQNEGRNSIFTSNIHKALKANTLQSNTCAVVFDNYSIFSVLTQYNINKLLIVFDNLRQQWVSIDSYNIASIKQFAVADQSENPTLYAITTDDKLYKLFLSAGYAFSDAGFKATMSGSPSVQLKLDNIRTIFSDGSFSGKLNAVNYTDQTLSISVLSGLTGRPLDNILFNFDRLSSIGWKVSPRIQWQTDARLSCVEVNVTPDSSMTPMAQQISRYAK